MAEEKIIASFTIIKKWLEYEVSYIKLNKNGEPFSCKEIMLDWQQAIQLFCELEKIHSFELKIKITEVFNIKEREEFLEIILFYDNLDNLNTTKLENQHRELMREKDYKSNAFLQDKIEIKEKIKNLEDTIKDLQKFIDERSKVFTEQQNKLDDKIKATVVVLEKKRKQRKYLVKSGVLLCE